jgi:enediyne biosynthesis protein E4
MHTKTTILSLLGLLPFIAFSQAFVKVTDPTNPITNYTFPSDYIYCGAAWTDVDNDGDIDLFAAPDRLFENLGGGKFQTKSTSIGAGISPGGWPFAGCSWADADNDGDTDCFLAFANSRLYLNNGSGSFSAHNTAPLNAANKSWAGALGDFNGDHLVDIALAKPIDPNNPGRSKLFVSNGKLTWESKGGLEFTDTDAPFTVPAWADFDDDGDYDLFIASGPAFTGATDFDFIYRNNLKETQSPTLERIKNLPFAAELQDGQSYGFVDYDNDGHLDICLANYQYAPNRLYRNTGAGVWTSVATPFTAPAQNFNLSNAWGDFDNDGDLDVIFTRDNDLPARLFLNDGTGLFTLDAGSAVSQQRGTSGASIGDYDNDGDLDVFLSGKTDGPRGRALFRNDLTGPNHWVSFKLTGVESNRTALGARVRIKVKIKGKSMWLRRDVSAQNTFQGHNDLRVHFGLGDAAVIDSFEVRFPSGKITACQGMATDRFYTIVEKNGVWDGCATPVMEVVLASPLRLSPNPAGLEIAVRLPEGAPPKEGLRVEITDSGGRRVLEQAFSEKIDVARLPPGFYLLAVRGAGKIWSGRFVKE